MDAPPARIGKYAGGSAMGKLTTRKRKALPAAEFAGPDRTYPVPDKSHARNALARVANKSPALKARVRSKVKQKYPSIGSTAGRGLINR